MHMPAPSRTHPHTQSRSILRAPASTSCAETKKELVPFLGMWLLPIRRTLRGPRSEKSSGPVTSTAPRLRRSSTRPMGGTRTSEDHAQARTIRTDLEHASCGIRKVQTGGPRAREEQGHAGDTHTSSPFSVFSLPVSGLRTRESFFAILPGGRG